MGEVAALRRVLIVGSSGAGKSTLAAGLGSRLGLPVVHLDREYWHPGWVPSQKDVWQERCRALAASERWILDGNYSGSLAPRLERADVIVFLDLPRRITIPRALRRWARWHGRSRPDMTDGCPERFTREFAGWLWRFPHGGRRRLLAAVSAAGAEDRLVRLRTRRAIAEWVEGVVRPVGLG